MRLWSGISAAAACLALLLAGCAREPERPNVLLIVVDTLRADRLSAAGYHRPLTPQIDALAREGLLFTRAQSPRAKTTPAVASLLTGLYPHDHGVRDLTTPLSADVPSLAEHLRGAGWRTGAIVGNYVLKDELSGLARGFDLWVEELPDAIRVPPHGVPQRAARSLTDGALCALGLGPPSADGAGPDAPFASDGEPWFLWLHYMDPHGLYDPPEEHLVFRRERPEPIPHEEPAPPGALHRRWIAEYNVLPEDRLSDGRIDAAAVRDRYDGEVRYADAEIGRLLGAMRAAGLLERTLVILTSDHGESLGEHDYWFEHGLYAYEATCRVPLVLRLPRRLGARVAPGPRGGDVSLADLAPTICELLGLPPLPHPARDGSPAGRSFAPLFGSAGERRRPVFSEKVERAGVPGAVQAKAVRIGDWKLIRRYARRPDAGRQDGARLALLGEELYELASDPAETHDLAGDPPAAAPLEELRIALFAFAAADLHFEELAELLERRRAELGRTDPRTLRALESLGY